ncbi:hypothetical protein GCM10022233_01760 [Streptomyces shaanxiensis]|uniref:Uncharacterized protein n=1 Tax=Streptomyces shaanxiensis TaxID=653357 RepID=A0ABP7U7G7_9ACTN
MRTRPHHPEPPPTRRGPHPFDAGQRYAARPAFEDEALSGPKRGSGGGSPQKRSGVEGAEPLEDGTGRGGGGEKKRQTCRAAGLHDPHDHTSAAPPTYPPPKASAPKGPQ